ncbi:hypothetical protein ACJZ2D_016730 [Fusarium nematophilum]
MHNSYNDQHRRPFGQVLYPVILSSTNHTPAGDTTGCTDASFDVSTTPEEMAQALLNDSEVRVSISRDDAIPGARTSSPAARLSSESQQEQDFDHTSRRSSDAGSEPSEAESGSPFGARVSPVSQECRSGAVLVADPHINLRWCKIRTAT